MNNLKKLLAGVLASVFFVTPVWSDEPMVPISDELAFFRHVDAFGQTTAIDIFADGIGVGFMGTPTFQLISASIESTYIGLEIGLPDGNQLVPIDIASLTISGMHGEDVPDAFLGISFHEDEFFAFRVADTRSTISLNEAGNLHISIDVPTGYIRLGELLWVTVSFAPELSVEWTDEELAVFLAEMFQFTLATSELGMNQVQMHQRFWLTPEDFETTMDYVHHRMFGTERTHLIDFLQPVEMTLTSDVFELTIISSVGITQPASRWAEVVTLVGLTGADLTQDPLNATFASNHALLISAPLTPFDGNTPHQLLYFDPETGIAYFAVRHIVHFFEEGQAVPDSLTINMQMLQFIAGHEHHVIEPEINLVALLADHEASWITIEALGDHFHRAGSTFPDNAFNEHFGLDPQWAWEEVNVILNGLDLPKPGELDIDLGHGVTLSNIGLQNNMLWVQVTQPQREWNDFSQADTWFNVFPTHWEGSPVELFSTNFSEQDDNWVPIGDLISNHVFLIEDISDLEALDMSIASSGFTKFYALDFNATFTTPLVTDGFFAEGPFQLTVGNYQADLSHVRLSATSLEFNLRGAEGSALEALDLEAALDIYLMTHAGTLEPLVTESFHSWGGDSISFE